MTLQNPALGAERRGRDPSATLVEELPVIVRWGEGSTQRASHATLRAVGPYTAILTIHGGQSIPAKLSLVNPVTGGTVMAEATWVGKRTTDGSLRVGVALAEGCGALGGTQSKGRKD